MLAPRASRADEPTPVVDLAELLQPILQKHKVPALAAAVVSGDRVIASGVAGIRREGSPQPALIGDCWQLGSCTKSMNATLIARLVEQDKLRWTSTIAELFPDLKDQIRPEYLPVTVMQFLCHRSGLPGRDEAGPVTRQLRALSGDIRQQRREMVRIVLSQPPASRPGEKMAYSNHGYAVTGAIVEQVTGGTWEDAMRTQVFEPLGMTSAGFGAPGTASDARAVPDQPRGHIMTDGTPRSREPGPGGFGPPGDEPRVLGPSGRVYCSIGDWAKYASLHLQGAKGRAGLLLKPESFKVLHTPPYPDGAKSAPDSPAAAEDADDNAPDPAEPAGATTAAPRGYALGWGVAPLKWSAGNTLGHTGSNGRWASRVRIAPGRDLAFVVACNLAPPLGRAAQDDVMAALVARFAAVEPPAQPAAAPAPPAPAPRDISAILQPIIEKNAIPGMAAAIIDGRSIVAIGAAGVRRAGDPTPVTIGDRWHLGSCTKSMTATLCAVLVEQGKLRWNMTLGEVYPNLKDMSEQYRAVTLEQLCTNRAGVPGNINLDGLWDKLWNFKGEPSQARQLLLEGVVSHPPASPPGTKFEYSNGNFAIAGHIAETVTGKPWETLMRDILFTPLGMSSAGFGAPGTPSRAGAPPDEPRGHPKVGPPIEPGPASDNPVAIGPAGIVHCTISDWARYIALHTTGEREGWTVDGSRVLTPEDFAKLHSPPVPDAGSDYAFGWGTPIRPWGDGKVLTHNGSNTMWFCVTWISPKKEFAVVVCCNSGAAAAPGACDAAAAALIGEAIKIRREAPKP